MLYKHFIGKLHGLQGLNIEENEKSILIFAETERTDTLHDYSECYYRAN